MKIEMEAFYVRECEIKEADVFRYQSDNLRSFQWDHIYIAVKRTMIREVGETAKQEW